MKTDFSIIDSPAVVEVPTSTLTISTYLSEGSKRLHVVKIHYHLIVFIIL